jgi:hypothetical protein
MLQAQGVASPYEKHTSSPASVRISSSAPTPAPKLRSCVVCRNRKVRCDKQSPCSNCRRANIACVFPSADRPLRWARRLERRTNKAAEDASPGAEKVMDRLRNLESLVKELRSQLEQAHAVAGSAGDSSSAQDRDAATEHQGDTNTSGVQHQFGRLVLQDSSHSRYVSSGFWSRVNDEVSRPVAIAQSS